MFREVNRYFDSGKKVCLVGVFALGNERDRFGAKVKAYFAAWIGALEAALRREGKDAKTAAALAEEIVVGIQGALVIARALDQPAVFTSTLRRLQSRLA